MLSSPGPDTPEHHGFAYVRAIESADLLDETVGQALTRAAREHGRDPALVWLTDICVESMTWSTVSGAADVVAATLLELNPRRERVALAAPNSVDWVVAMLGCARAGMTVVPISPTATNSEAQHMLSQTRVGMVLAAERIADRAVRESVEEVTRALPWPVMVRDIADLGGAPPTSVPQPDVQPGDELLIQHTSGTTGQPKAAILSHRAALNCGRVWGHAMGLQAGETWLNPLPLHHVGGSVTGVLTALSIGATYFVVDRFSPHSVLAALRGARPTAVGLVPTMIIDLLAVPGVSAQDFASVRTVAGGAAAVDQALIEDMERQLGVTCMVGYGQSESPAITASAPDDPTTARTQTLGRCLPGRDVHIADAAGQVVPIGSVGELCVRGPLTMSGYLRADGSIDRALDGAGWLHTGDLCTMDDHGVLTFRGRLREVIVRGGENVYPTEIEHALTAHPAVAEAAVFGVPDERLGERVVAALLPAAGEIDLAELATFVESRLSRHKRPAEWMVAADFPRTSTGKVRKFELRRDYDKAR